MVATPIGNLADLTLRAVHVLARVDAVACEDKRVTAQLLNHLGLHKPLLALHGHNEHEAAAAVLAMTAFFVTLALSYDAQTIYRSGFSVYTTLMPGLQDLAQAAVKEQVDGLTPLGSVALDVAGVAWEATEKAETASPPQESTGAYETAGPEACAPEARAPEARAPMARAPMACAPGAPGGMAR